MKRTSLIAGYLGSFILDLNYILILLESSGSSCKPRYLGVKEMQHGRSLALSSLLLVFSVGASAGDWAQFRGPGGLGISDETGLPLTWSSEENLIWKTPLPGYGASSPIVVGDKIFVTCYGGYGVGGEDAGDQANLKLHLVCCDRASGEVVWNKSVDPQLPEKPYQQFLPEHGYASGTPASDGKAIYVFFGRSGVWAFDLDGTKLWNADVGSETHIFGSANSPLLVGDYVIINASIESGSLVALEKSTGEEVWRADGIDESWNTPVLVNLPNGETEVVLTITGKILSFDPQTGSPFWNCESAETYICPSVVVHDGTVFAIGGRGPYVAGVKAGGRGDVTETHRLWVAEEGSNVPSPVYHDGHLYWVNDGGIAHCVNAETGETVYKQRVDGAEKTYASALLAEGRLYVVTWHSGTFVLDAKPEFKVLARNILSGDDSVFNASPAVSDGQLILRSNKFLYCVGNQAN